MEVESSLETRNTPSNVNSEQRSRKFPSCLHTPELIPIYLLGIFFILLILFRIQSLHIPLSTSWHQWKEVFIPNTSSTTPPNLEDYKYMQAQLDSIASKLQESVTFLPLKDIRYSQKPEEGHTWFMSSTLDIQEEGQVQYQEFPSNASKGRVLCLKGKDKHDGSWNSYALAWPHALPHNASLKKGLTFVSHNHYDYDNIWHGLSTTVPFVAWHIKNKCSTPPARWVLYHWGELRSGMAPWLCSLIEATFGVQSLNIEMFEDVDDNTPTCFERAVVMRHNEGGMSNEKRLEVYDLLRCKARSYCNVSLENEEAVRMTMFMRTGARSFTNDSVVIEIFDKACRKVERCRLLVAYSNNLTFCEQVKLMSSTDVLVSPHGAQLTNMFMMDRNSSVLEFFPKGWLKLAGVGQYVYHWLASWSGMNHRGAWRDPDTANRTSCPFPEDDFLHCFNVYKSAQIGYNETYFSEWATNVLNDHLNNLRSKPNQQQQGGITNMTTLTHSLPSTCSCY